MPEPGGAHGVSGRKARRVRWLRGIEPIPGGTGFIREA
jgi:hypothetical protein